VQVVGADGSTWRHEYNERGNLIAATDEYRITKYDPHRRDEHGSYPEDDWTAFSDVGREFGGVALTREEYDRVESSYLNAVQISAEAEGTSEFCVVGLELHGKPALELREGQRLNLPDALEVVRGLLREAGFWCRLESDRGFAHIGWDYYMYLGATADVSGIIPAVKALGLYIESGWSSPYHPEVG
jgi:YD repeat-containing protein